MATFKELQEMIEKSGVDPAKIKINNKVANEIKVQIKDQAFARMLNKKSKPTKKSE
jgi:hypothetical protein